MVSPEFLIYLITREDSPLMLPEECEDSVFLGGEIDLNIISHHSLCISIEYDISNLIGFLQMSSLSSSTPLKDILDTQTELLQVKRLHQIVICSECEPLDTIDLLAECREEQERYYDTTIYEHPHERESIDARDHTINYETVIRARS
jgi:hypothetical protein